MNRHRSDKESDSSGRVRTVEGRGESPAGQTNPVLNLALSTLFAHGGAKRDQKEFSRIN